MRDLPKTKKEALEKGEMFYFTGEECKNGHVSERYANDGGCKQCRIDRGKKRYLIVKDDLEYIESKRIYDEKYRNENRKEINEKRKIHYFKNKEMELLYHKNWANKNRKYLNRYMKDWRMENPEKQAKSARKSRNKHRDKRNAYQREWKKNNRHYFNKREALRRAMEKQAIPSWDTNNEIAKELLDVVYKVSQNCKKLLKEEYHVDHVIPLKGKRRLDDKGKMVHVVCGLHTPANLQIIPGKDNIEKNCYEWPDM